jgi:hypothetical protein
VRAQARINAARSFGQRSISRGSGDGQHKPCGSIDLSIGVLHSPSRNVTPLQQWRDEDMPGSRSSCAGEDRAASESRRLERAIEGSNSMEFGVRLQKLSATAGLCSR